MGLVNWTSKIFLVTVLLSQQFWGLLGYATMMGEKNLEEGATYDFIIVGGGTAGCVLAGRLAETGKYTVLLIEMGGFPLPDLEIPALAVQNTAPNIRKIYPTVPQANAGLANKGVINFLRGNLVGGSSGINAMLFNRGSPEDYNNWGKLTGDPSWNYANMLQYLRKFENYTGDNPTNHRGSGGPISVSTPRYAYALGMNEWFQAGREMGYKIGGPNDPQRMSFTSSEFAYKRGRRVSSYKGYIEPMLQTGSSHRGRISPNLHLLINTEAKRIIFEGNKAVGVRFSSNSTRATFAMAKKEVILTAGVIESPLMLMRSGIRPKSVLDSGHAPAIKYLPGLGKNLMDHISVTTTVVFGNRSLAHIPERDLNDQSWRMYNLLGDGPYTSTFGVNGQGFIFSSTISPHDRALGWPDLQLLPQNTNLASVLASGGEVSDLKETEVPVQWSSYVSRPKSRGTLTLNPKDMEGLPLLDFQYFSHPDDMQVIIDGIKMFLRICEETFAFRRIGCRVPTDALPACRQHKFRSDSYWKCYVKQSASTGLHGAGTCAMGSGPEDPQAVVDTKLRVIGIEGLRVVDASIMPVITNANIMAAVYAIAEKGADMILERWDEGGGPGTGLEATFKSIGFLNNFVRRLR